MTIADIKDILLEKQYTIVIYKSNASVYVSNDRGVTPLIRLLKDNKMQLKEALVADKVIGKAAALLMVYAGVKEVYTPIISVPALQVFNNHNIIINYDKIVKRIINRNGDGLCPMETLCIDIESPETAFDILSQKIDIQ